MLKLRRVDIENFACFDRIVIEPSTDLDQTSDGHSRRERLRQDDILARSALGDVRREGTARNCLAVLTAPRLVASG